jgi:hypothetical protein
MKVCGILSHAGKRANFERTAATRANARVGFVHLLDQPRPGTPQPARELIGATGMLRARFGRIGRLARRRDDVRRGGIGRAASVMIPGIVGDLGGFGMIAQTIEYDGRMDHLEGRIKALAQDAEKPAVVLETEAEHHGDGHDILTNGQIAQNVSIDVFGKQQGALPSSF